MVDALEAGIKNPKTALGFMELGAKVLDKTEEAAAGRVVHFHIHTNVNPFALRKTGEERGLIGRPALPPPCGVDRAGGSRRVMGSYCVRNSCRQSASQAA
jgi:hypothetical protein